MDDTHDKLYKAYMEYHKANEQFEKRKSYRTKITARKFLSLIRRLAIKRRAEIMADFNEAKTKRS
jgi:hypothetical protein